MVDMFQSLAGRTYELIFVSEVLVGELVGLTEIEEDHWLVKFTPIELGLISPSFRFHRFTVARPGRREALRNRNSLNHVPGSQCQP